MNTLWLVFRFLLFGAALSLAAYIPFKYFTQLHAIEGIYAFLFPLSSVVAVAGILLAFRPGSAAQLPLWARTGISVIAVGWIATGLICVPSLSRSIAAHPLDGLFRAFHMTAQHVFLSSGVVLGLLVPGAMFAFFGQTPPAAVEKTRRARSARSEAP